MTLTKDSDPANLPVGVEPIHSTLDSAIAAWSSAEWAHTQSHSSAPPPWDAEHLIEDHILPHLDPVFVDFFVNVIAKRPPAHTIPLEEARKNPEILRPQIALDSLSGEYERVQDHEVVSKDGEKFTVRVYHPDPAKFGEGPYGLHLNFHGGGFVIGDLHCEAQLCLSMREAGVVVVDVDYRLCPEVGEVGKCFEDAWAALNWVRSPETSKLLNTNPDSISIGGISAGGNLSLALQHMARDAGIPLKLCMATVPSTLDVLAYKHVTESPFKSFMHFSRGPVLPWKRIKYFGQFAFPPDKVDMLRAKYPDFWFAPLRAKRWDGLCETYIRTGEADPLRDEGEAYARKLIEEGHGVNVCVKRYKGAPHTFMYFDKIGLKSKVEFDEDSKRALRAAHFGF